MKKLILCFVFSISNIFLIFGKDKPKVTLKEVTVEAPFIMPAIKTPDFSNCIKLSILDFGAIKGNKEKTSKAINKAINKANKMGGGIVIIPEGEWLTSKIHFKSNVNLHLTKGSILLFSDNPIDYLPAVRSSWEGYECMNYSPLIYAYQCKNIAITGEGEIKAQMSVWKEWFKRPTTHLESLKKLYFLATYNKPLKERQMVNDSANFRPQFIQFNRCENILMDGISISNSPFWTIHPFLSKNIILRNLKVYAHGHNNDGVDPEMSQNILIENCFFDQGDDAIAIKSGSNQDAWRLNTPSKNIVIRNCTVKNGHQLVAIGSELSGGVENVFIDKCTVLENAKLNHLLFIKTNERRGGYVNNIFMSNIIAGKMGQGVLGIDTDVMYQWRELVPTIERRLTTIKNIHIENIKTTEVKFISRILGQKELPIENVFLKNVHADLITDNENIHLHLINFVHSN